MPSDLGAWWQVMYEDCRMVSLTAPYVSGFLAFREVPFLVDAVQQLREKEPRLMPQAGISLGWRKGPPQAPPHCWERSHELPGEVLLPQEGSDLKSWAPPLALGCPNLMGKGHFS